MNRWSAYGRLDSQVLQEGDSKFIGVDMTRDRPLLGPGMLARAENKRMRNGAAVTRLGNVLVGDFNPFFVNRFIGSGIYSNPNGAEVMLIAESGTTYVWALQYGKDPVKVNLAAGQTLAGGVSAVEFVQAFDKVLLLRRAAGVPLVWDGVAGNTFNPITYTPGTSDPLVVVPPVWHGEPFQNRVLYYDAQYPALPWSYRFLMSEVLMYNAYDPILGVFMVNAGESDWITRIYSYFQQSIIVFKRRTIHQCADFTIDASLMTQRQLSKRHGLCATKCVVEVGRELFFLDEPGGIYRLNEVIQDQVATEPEPVSDSIQPLIDRIYWPQAEIWACAEVLKDYAFFALPIDDAKDGGNNVVAVYNTSSQQWESAPDQWGDPSFRIHALHVTQYQGGRALFGVDYTAQKVYALYQAPTDEIKDQVYPINDVMETRGYVMGNAQGFKRFQRTVMALRTVDPVITVSAITDGVNEVKTLNPSPLTKDRLKFYPQGQEDFDPETGDPTESKREDYSTGSELIEFVGQDFESFPVGFITFIPPSEVPSPGPKQESLEPFSVRQNGRWLSMRVENLGLGCDVLSIGVEAIALERTRTAA